LVYQNGAASKLAKGNEIGASRRDARL